jgi:excisionase family DNA binding protein
MNNSPKKKSPKEPVRYLRYLTRAEVAKLLEVSPSSISRWARQGRLPAIQTIGGRRRYLKETILPLIKELAREEKRVASSPFYKEKRGDAKY